MNISDVHKVLIKTNLDKNPNFQVYSKGDEIGDLHRNMLMELVEWTMTFNRDNYNNIFRAFPWDVENATKEECKVFGNKLIEIHFDTTSDTANPQWRLIWRDFVIGWYKHPRRCITVNRLLSDEERTQFITECKFSLHEYVTKSRTD